jgi:hypothetical protein
MQARDCCRNEFCNSLWLYCWLASLAAAAEVFLNGKLIVVPPSLPTGPVLGMLTVVLGVAGSLGWRLPRLP